MRAGNTNMVFKHAGDTISIQGEQSAKGLQFVDDNVTLTPTKR